MPNEADEFFQFYFIAAIVLAAVTIITSLASTGIQVVNGTDYLEDMISEDMSSIGLGLGMMLIGAIVGLAHFGMLIFSAIALYRFITREYDVFVWIIPIYHCTWWLIGGILGFILGATSLIGIDPMIPMVISGMFGIGLGIAEIVIARMVITRYPKVAP